MGVGPSAYFWGFRYGDLSTKKQLRKKIYIQCKVPKLEPKNGTRFCSCGSPQVLSHDHDLPYEVFDSEAISLNPKP